MRHQIISMAHEFEKENESAFNLWLSLPSYKEAEKYHGDYATEFIPSIADIMYEATMFISHNLSPTEENIKEAGNWYKCPCGEDHINIEGE